MAAIKVIEVIGVSSESWHDAATSAVNEASKTVRNITGIDVMSQTAKVKEGVIVEYHTAVKIAFRVD